MKDKYRCLFDLRVGRNRSNYRHRLISPNAEYTKSKWKALRRLDVVFNERHTQPQVLPPVKKHLNRPRSSANVSSEMLLRRKRSGSSERPESARNGPVKYCPPIILAACPCRTVGVSGPS